MSLIYGHLYYWTCPSQQRYIVRLLMMVPIYSIDSWLSLIFQEQSIYFDIFRDCYEAYVMYQFFCLLTVYIEGDDNSGKLFEMLEKKDEIHYPYPLCFLRPFKPSPWFLLVSKQFILQYVVVKPFISIIAAVLESLDLYNEGNFLPWYGFVYCTTLNLTSVNFSMYFLIWFYVTSSDELQEYKPIPKFLCIKSVIFFSFWQGVLIAALSYFEVIPDVGEWSKEDISRSLQDFIICIEMFLLSIAHHFVFDYTAYKVPKMKKSIIQRPLRHFSQVINQKDMFIDIKNTYNINKYKEAKRQYKASKERYIELKKSSISLEMVTDETNVELESAL
uniref:Transmembrane protein 184C n=1 Tax=Arcella intermedia TaxID=1963864 RepID=A0A6B2L8T7_9EUKA